MSDLEKLLNSFEKAEDGNGWMYYGDVDPKAAKAELEAMQSQLIEARNIIIEADALSNMDKQPRNYEEASLAVVRMMSEGIQALHDVEAMRKVTVEARKVVALYMSQDTMAVTVAFDDALHGLNNTLKGLQE